jgi:hypothetical protein
MMTQQDSQAISEKGLTREALLGQDEITMERLNWRGDR